MRKAPFSIARSTAGTADHSQWISIAALGGLIFTLNAMVAMRLFVPLFADHFASLADAAGQLQMRDLQLWGVVNASLLSCYLLVCWRYTGPMARMTQLLQQTAQSLGKTVVASPPTATAMLKEMANLSALVQEQVAKRAELKRELDAARHVLAQCTVQQQTILRTTNREIITQYQSVLSYAHYLDEHIQQRSANSDLRYDFDDVCESSFNLKLIAGALEMLRQSQAPHITDLPLAALMQQTMLALTPSLDRRVMQLTTAEVDESVIARSDAGALSHVIWMLLLGMIRYAAEESTLRMRCFYNRDRTEVMLSIVVSEMTPGALSPEERGAYLIRQMQHGSPHMFAETIKIHANIQLAELLLRRLEAHISVVPLSAYACEVCLRLPAAMVA